MQAPVQQFAQVIDQTLGSEAVLGMVMFGPIASGSWDATRHKAQSVLVLRQIDLQLLRKLAEQGPQLGKLGIAAPLVMTPEYIEASLDTFPLEFIEIHQAHLRVLGRDYFEPLAVQESDVRHQCERDLKAVLLGMRQGLLGSLGEETELGRLDADIAQGLLRVLRGMLWNNQLREARTSAEVVAEVEKLVERKLPGVLRTLAAEGEHGWNEFRSLYEDIEAILNFVDRW